MAFEPYLTRGFDPNAVPRTPYDLATYERERDGYAGLRAAVERFPQVDGHARGLIDEVKKANLRGRGGAGFSAGMKWSFVPQPPNWDGPKYLVCNADESEPGTFKDIVLIEQDPHRVIEGILIACWAVGIRQAFIFIRGEFAEGARTLERAIEAAREAGYLGTHVLGSEQDFEITLVRGAGAYICGEETGMLSAMEGKRAYPKLKPPFPANPGGGLFGAPTVINNVETLANLPFIARQGADWFTSIGPDKNHGSKLVCLSGHIAKPGVYEIEIGTPLAELIESDEYGGGVRGGRALKAVIPGGSSSHVLTAEAARAADYSFDGLHDAGSMLGSGAIIVMDEDTCMVDALYNLIRFYHHESCGQCTPCREGSGWAEGILKRIVRGKGKQGDVELLNEIGHNGVGRTVCVLMEAFAWPIWSFTEKFRDEFDFFIEHGRSRVTGGGVATARARSVPQV